MKILEYFQTDEWDDLLPASVKVLGEYFTLDVGLDNKSIKIIDCEGRCEVCVINEDGDVVSESGENLTEEWPDSEWKALTAFCKSELPFLFRASGELPRGWNAGKLLRIRWPDTR